MSNFEVGDEVECLLWGVGNVISVSDGHRGYYSVEVKFSAGTMTFCPDGHCSYLRKSEETIRRISTKSEPTRELSINDLMAKVAEQQKKIDELTRAERVRKNEEYRKDREWEEEQIAKRRAWDYDHTTNFKRVHEMWAPK